MAAMFCALYGHQPRLHKGSCVCQSCKVTLSILVNDGDTFLGTPSQWKDCFFAYACLGEIGEYCEDRGWKLEYREEVRPS